jgi:hypothetical protein
MHRRAFLTATAATASAVTLKAAYAATVTPFGATGVPGSGPSALFFDRATNASPN